MHGFTIELDYGARSRRTLNTGARSERMFPLLLTYIRARLVRWPCARWGRRAVSAFSSICLLRFGVGMRKCGTKLVEMESIQRGFVPPRLDYNQTAAVEDKRARQRRISKTIIR